MEYMTYILIVVGQLALCVVWLLRTAPPAEREERARSGLMLQARPAEKPKTKEEEPDSLISAATAYNRESLNIPIPWGWPGHHEHDARPSRLIVNGGEAHVVSDPLHRFVDRLLAEKQTVQSRDYVLKKDACIRALIEDRYGKARTAPGMRRQAAAGALISGSDEPLSFERPKELKTPWGW